MARDIKLRDVRRYSSAAVALVRGGTITWERNTFARRQKGPWKASIRTPTNEPECQADRKQKLEALFYDDELKYEDELAMRTSLQEDS